MKTLSDSTREYLRENAIDAHYNEATDKFEIHYPSDNLDYCDTEEEVLDNVKEYLEFWNSL